MKNASSIQSLYSLNPLLSPDLSQLTEKDLAPKNDSTFFKSIKVVFYTPFYLIAYSVKSVIIICLRVVNFVISNIKIFNSDTHQNISAKIDSWIQSINCSIDNLSPWSESKKSCKTSKEQKSLKSNPNSLVDRGITLPPLRSQKIAVIALLIFVLPHVLRMTLSQSPSFKSPSFKSPSFKSPSSCISDLGIPKTFEEAKNILRCNNPSDLIVDNSKDWSETKKTIRSMTRFSHPDKGANPQLQLIVNAAHNIMKKAYTTEKGQRDLKIYQCISQISTPRTEHDLKNAEKIISCADISPYPGGCPSIAKAANKMLNQIAWVGKSATRQLSYAYSCICVWQPLWERPFEFPELPKIDFRFSKRSRYKKY